jgi:hypothetical protein
MRSGKSEEAERTISEFFNNSGVGLAIIDRELRFRMVNPYLAAINGAAVESHIGKHVLELLGQVGIQIAPLIQRVLASNQAELNREISGVLPMKAPQPGHWLCSYFPIADSYGSVKEVGAVIANLQAPIHLNPPPSRDNLQILRSWKDIAHYLGTCVKTAQRWEHQDNFPVRRITEKKGAVVFALREEVDTWLRSHRLNTKI